MEKAWRGLISTLNWPPINISYLLTCKEIKRHCASRILYLIVLIEISKLDVWFELMWIDR